MDNHLYYPSIEGSDLYERIELSKVRELLPHYRVLEALGRVNGGREAVILASGSNGLGVPTTIEAVEHYLAATKIRSQLMEVGYAEPLIVPNATKDDLEEAIVNEYVAHIILIGHASFHSWVATNGSVNWYDAAKMVGSHLKDGLFANLGCGDVRSWNSIPLGNFVVSSQGMLLAAKAERTNPRTMSSLANYDQVKRRVFSA